MNEKGFEVKQPWSLLSVIGVRVPSYHVSSDRACFYSLICKEQANTVRYSHTIFVDDHLRTKFFTGKVLL